jgi:hypothetical protein
MSWRDAMSILPKHLRDVQELFRERANEQNRRMDALFENEGHLVPSAKLLAEIRSAKIMETTSAEEFLAKLDADISVWRGDYR